MELRVHAAEISFAQIQLDCNKQERNLLAILDQKPACYLIAQDFQ